MPIEVFAGLRAPCMRAPQPAQHLRGQDGTVPPFTGTHTTGGPGASPETAPGQVPPRPARAGRSQRDNDHRDRTVTGHRIHDPHVIIGAGMTHLGRSAIPIAATDPNLPTPRCHAASAAGTEFRAEPRKIKIFPPERPWCAPCHRLRAHAANSTSSPSPACALSPTAGSVLPQHTDRGDPVRREPRTRSPQTGLSTTQPVTLSNLR